MALEDSSSSEDEDDFDTVLGMIFNDDVRRPRRGSQIGCIRINRDRAEGQAKIMRDFGVLQRRFAIVRDPAEYSSSNVL